MQVIAAIRDITEQKAARELAERRRLEEAILDATEEEKSRIGRDLHDDLGQSLLGLALMTKLLEERLEKKGLSESGAAAEIVRRTNEAIQKTRDLSRAHRVAAQMVCGNVYINGARNVHPAAPFGGVGLSGFGKEGGRWGIEEFIRQKSVGVELK